MESPLIIYEQTKRIDNIEDYAYERLFENYLKYNLKEEKKLIEIDSTDQESLIKEQISKLPIPGMIYTFLHLNDKAIAVLKDEKTETEYHYHDITPILFCTYYHTTNKTIGGINLNLLPEIERLKFFIAYYDRYKEFFEDVEELTENRKIAINKKYVSLVLSGKGQGMIKAFNKIQRSLFDYGYRSYKIENIRKLRMIEFEEWKFIPFFSPQQSFKRINLNVIYNTYWNNKNKTI
jgi:hypothetical protein